MKIKHVFPIWNIGDPYIKGDMNKVRKSIENDIQFYDAGFSIDAKKFRVEGFEKWGHVITANKHYTKKIDGVSVKMLIENWLSDQGQTTLVKHWGWTERELSVSLETKLFILTQTRA